MSSAKTPKKTTAIKYSSPTMAFFGTVLSPMVATPTCLLQITGKTHISSHNVIVAIFSYFLGTDKIGIDRERSMMLLSHRAMKLAM